MERGFSAICLASFVLPLIASPAASARSTPDLVLSSGGRLEESDRRAADQGSFDDHRVGLERGVRYRITACAWNFDTLIRVYRSNGGTLVAENDDDALGSDTNSGIYYVPEETSDHIVRVMGTTADSLGRYAVSVERAPAHVAHPPMPRSSRLCKSGDISDWD